MIDLTGKLPFWLSGTEAARLARAAQAYWVRAENWLTQALAQADVSTCTEAALAYHAADRGIIRLPGEPLDNWRGRVLHAQRTGIESGSRAGLEFILGVYGVWGAAVLERQPDQDWDIVEVVLDPNALNGASTDVLDRIFHKWGRLCRRYVISHLDPAVSYWSATCTSELQHTEVAR